MTIPLRSVCFMQQLLGFWSRCAKLGKLPWRLEDGNGLNKNTKLSQLHKELLQARNSKHAAGWLNRTRDATCPAQALPERCGALPDGLHVCSLVNASSQEACHKITKTITIFFGLCRQVKETCSGRSCSTFYFVAFDLPCRRKLEHYRVHFFVNRLEYRRLHGNVQLIVHVGTSFHFDEIIGANIWESARIT
jgi:hypothetical protein